MPTKTPFQLVLEIAEEQRRSLEQSCLQLDCSVWELESRVNRLEPRALEALDLLLGAGWRLRLVK